MGGRRKDGRAQGHDQRQASATAQGVGTPRMHTPGLHITLQPSGALRQPSVHRARRCLPSRTVDDAELPAERPQAKAQVSVLGDIVRVPAARAAQSRHTDMIAGAAKRKRQAQPRHARQGHFKQGRIFKGELPIQKPGARLAGCSDAQRRLKTTQPGLCDEARRRLAELLRMRSILCVIDGDQIAPRVAQGVVQSARLGLGAAGRCDQDFHPRRFGRRLGCGQGGLIMRFQHDEGLQPVRRIVDPAEVGDQLRRHRRLIVKRRQNGVARPFDRTRNRRRASQAGDADNGLPQRAHDEGGLEHHQGDVDGVFRPADQRHGGCQRKQDQGRDLETARRAS
jgi:hypothetical protein